MSIESSVERRASSVDGLGVGMSIKTLSGEDRVIIVAMVCISILIIAALAAISISPTIAGNVASVLAGAVVAIGALAARHPPVVSPIIPAQVVTDIPLVK